jgi:hypothetical protein
MAVLESGRAASEALSATMSGKLSFVVHPIDAVTTEAPQLCG